MTGTRKTAAKRRAPAKASKTANLHYPPSMDEFYKALTRKTEYEIQFAQDIRKEIDASQQAARLYTFNGDIEDHSVNNCISCLGQWHREEPGEKMTVVFNSPGGMVHAGFALYDYIKAIQGEGTPIDTHALGWAASMGGVLLQAGGERTMGRHAYMLVHEIQSMTGGSTTIIEDELKFVQRLQDRALNILADRATITRARIKRNWKRKDWWLDAEEALEVGFIDRIV